MADFALTMMRCADQCRVLRYKLVELANDPSGDNVVKRHLVIPDDLAQGPTGVSFRVETKPPHDFEISFSVAPDRAAVNGKQPVEFIVMRDDAPDDDTLHVADTIDELLELLNDFLDQTTS